MQCYDLQLFFLPELFGESQFQFQNFTHQILELFIYLCCLLFKLFEFGLAIVLSAYFDVEEG